MTDIILHHFDPSPFAEKVRLAFGIKGLDWKAVQIPMIMPKPNLMPLTGGYRKTPVLQIGADIYCDSNLIIDQLERLFPTPSFFPAGAGLTRALSNWSDVAFFQPGAGLSMGLNQGLPEPLLNDRKAFFKFMDFDSLSSSIPNLYSQFLAQVELLEQQLSGGDLYLSGDFPGAADILGYFPIWMARGNFPSVDEWLLQFPNVLQWEMLMQAVGHGNWTDVSEEYALQQAKLETPIDEINIIKNPEGLSAEADVKVTPTDYGEVSVSGKLKVLTNQKIVIAREDPRVGLVNNHFPRSGFRLELA
jgi:glutathione S-transferase